MSCPIYKTSRGLQIGGIDPNKVENEPKTEETIPSEEVIEPKAEKPKATKKTATKSTKKR